MRKLLILTLMWLLPAIVFAGVVTSEQALVKATSFANARNVNATIKLATKAKKSQTVDATAYYYVFNFGNNQGFVIISGDDRTNPILGYSDEGSFNIDKIPTNMKSWLDGYESQLKALATMSDTEASERIATSSRASVPTHNSIAPMITTKWDQATPYWNECPQFMNSYNEEDGYELAYTGCVATSMAQIMNFYKYPEATPQVIPSYTFSYSTGLGEYVSVDMEELPITTFDWAHMKDSYTGAEDEVYTSAVAHLMYYVGCAVKSQYGISATGAYTDDIPNGFALFGYGSKLAYRNDYTQEVWNNMVYEELAAGRPMIYNGTAGSGGGHSFICDGYEFGDYFHINWGWSGMGNGYFQLAILNPHESGIGGSSSAEGYNMKQNIVYNIVPGGSAPVDDPEEPVLTVTAISGPTITAYPEWERDKLSDPFKIYKSKIVKVSYSDHSASGKKFKTALALYDPNTDSFTIATNSEQNGYYTVTTSAVGYTRQFGQDVAVNDDANVIKFGAGVTGTRRLVGVYQLEGTSEWKLMKESDRHYLELEITNYAAEASEHPIVNLQATNWDFTGGERVGVKEQVHVTVKNNSVDRFFGDLYLDFGGQQIDEYSQYTTVVTAEILAGQEAVITFNVTPASSGTKTVKLMRLNKYGEYVTIPSTASVIIGESSEATELNLSVVINAENAVPADNPNDFDVIYDSYAHFSATITNNSNGEYSKYVLAPLFLVEKNPDGTVAGGDMVTYKQSQLSLQPGESKTLYFDFDNLAYGSTYAMNIYARNFVPDDEEGTHVENIVEPGHSVYYDIMPGIVTWSADGSRNGYKPIENFQVGNDVAAVSLEALNINNIVPNDNPNTIYFVDEDANVPLNLNGLNVVVGNSASFITLEDGYPYFIPKSFTAESISYERTFNTGRVAGQDGGFSTVVLPFAPTNVIANDKELERYNAGTDAAKDYWMLYFSNEDDGVANFDYVSQIEANVPYVMAVNSKLVGTPVTMAAENVLLKPEAIAYTSANNYVMAGTFINQNLENIYVMNAQGNRFVLNSESQNVNPFRAYFNTLGQVSDSGYIEITLNETPEEPIVTLMGDVTGDGTVDIDDVNAVINIILKVKTQDDYPGNADLTGEGDIDVDDMNMIINIILSSK